MNLHNFAAPSLVKVGQQSNLNEYLLVLQVDSEIRSLADQKGKRVEAVENVMQWSDILEHAAYFSYRRLGGGRNAL